jgi:BMFP domain-containing protein YqiC
MGGVFVLITIGMFCLTAYKIVEMVLHHRSNDDIKNLAAKNEELQQRIENLETIITGIDSELLDGMIKISSLSEAQKNQKVIGDMASRINDKSGDSIEKNIQSIMSKFLRKVDKMLEDPKK